MRMPIHSGENVEKTIHEIAIREAAGLSFRYRMYMWELVLAFLLFIQIGLWALVVCVAIGGAWGLLLNGIYQHHREKMSKQVEEQRKLQVPNRPSHLN